MAKPGPWRLMGVCSCGGTVPVSKITVVGPPDPERAHVLYAFAKDVCPACGLRCVESCKLKAVREVPISVWWDPRAWGKFTVEVKDVAGIESIESKKEKSK